MRNRFSPRLRSTDRHLRESAAFAGTIIAAVVNGARAIDVGLPGAWPTLTLAVAFVVLGTAVYRRQPFAVLVVALLASVDIVRSALVPAASSWFGSTTVTFAVLLLIGVGSRTVGRDTRRQRDRHGGERRNTPPGWSERGA